MGMPEKKALPSLFVCCLLLPHAFLFSGEYAVFHKNIASGRRFFLELIESQKKMGGIFARRPRWQAMPSAFLLHAACYIYKHGNLLKATINTTKKIHEYGIKGSLHLIVAHVQQILTDKKRAHQRVLVMLGKSTQAMPALLDFLKLLKQVGYELEMFVEENSAPTRTLRALRSIGVRRVFSKNLSGEIMPFLYESGDFYRTFIITPDQARHDRIDCALHVSSHGNILCLCDDSAELKNFDKNLLEKLHCIVCYKQNFLPSEVVVAELPPQFTGKNREDVDDRLWRCLDTCDLLPVKLFADYLSSRKFPASGAGAPVISFFLHGVTEEKQSKATAMLLLSAAVKVNLPCEIIFGDRSVPLWARDVTAPWRHVSVDNVFSPEFFRSVEAAAAGEFILCIKAGVLLVSGLGEMVSIMRSSPEIGLCGCRMLDMTGFLREAGAYMQDGKTAVIGSGASRAAPFYRVTRSVPLLPVDAFLLRRCVSFPDGTGNGLIFPEESGTHIGFASGSANSLCFAATPKRISPALPRITRLKKRMLPGPNLSRKKKRPCSRHRIATCHHPPKTEKTGL
jgi:hypothetical protein